MILRGYGIADLEAGSAVGADDVRFEIGSITKLFTWIAVMMLVEEGRIDLDADIAHYLRTVEVRGDEPLTMAQLMSHRPGMARLLRFLVAGAPERWLPRHRSQGRSR